MNNRSFMILIVLLVALAGIAGVASMMKRGPSSDNELFLPALADSLNDVRRITISRAGQAPVATLVKGDNQWTVVESNSYRANISRIRHNLIELSKARIIEQKTALPEYHSRLGVQDIKLPGATGSLLEIESEGEAFAVIIGQTGVGGGSMAYSRFPDDNQSLMISADLDLGSGTTDWLDQEIMDISSGRIFAVTVTRPDGEIFRIEKSSQDATDFELVDIPDGRSANITSVTNSLGTTLSSLELDNVEPSENFDPPSDDPVIVTFEAWDGLVIEVRAWETSDGIRVVFAASSDAELAQRFADSEVTDSGSAEETATQINERVSGWIYTLPRFKSAQLIKTRNDFLEPETS
jgi:hypothetical protein